MQECHVLTLKFDYNSDDNYFSEVYCNDVAQALRSFFKHDIFFKNAMEGVIVSRKVQKITLYIDRKTTIHNSTQRCENVSRNLYDNSGFTFEFLFFHKTFQMHNWTKKWKVEFRWFENHWIFCQISNRIYFLFLTKFDALKYYCSISYCLFSVLLRRATQSASLIAFANGNVSKQELKKVKVEEI